MSEHLRVKVLFNDDDMVNLQADVATAVFKGRTEAYSSYRLLGEWLERLRSFAPALDSVVKFEAGYLEGSSHIGVELARLDWSGHCACRVSLLADGITHFEGTPHNTMEVRLVVEPGAIASFVSELATLIETEGGEATLKGLAQS